ncbi:hypothetical protein [uncultured Clostridium sp.]|jgi:hypothetical protein|uniref:hypothetical protein n=1 Tax=uncultured Clostridium sp. TaxID=59620 RepID=UPI00263275D2|nr:hypothetical protein [uncultured Clostridium sp.]
MTKGKKIGIIIAIILGIGILIAGVFTKPKTSTSNVDPSTYSQTQVQKLNQLQELTTNLYKDEETTDIAQLKSQIKQIGGSQDSLFTGMITDLDSVKSDIGQDRYTQIKTVLESKVQPSYKQVITDANEIATNGYDKNPGQTVENYQNAMRAISDAENVLAGAQNTNNSQS